MIVASKSRERGDAAVQELKQEASPEAKVECMQIDLASFRYKLVSCEFGFREDKQSKSVYFVYAAQSVSLQKNSRSATCLCMCW